MLGDEAFLLRYSAGDDAKIGCLIVNLGARQIFARCRSHCSRRRRAASGPCAGRAKIGLWRLRHAAADDARRLEDARRIGAMAAAAKVRRIWTIIEGVGDG